MTDKPFRYTFDREGRVMQTKPPRPTTGREPKPRRTASTRKYCTETSARILAACYPGEVPSVVIERALAQMAKRDGKRIPRRPS